MTAPLEKLSWEFEELSLKEQVEEDVGKITI